MKYELKRLNLAPNQSEILPNSDTDFPVSAYLANLNNYIMHEVPWHWHREFEVMIVTTGAALIFLGEDTVRVPKGGGIFCNSNVLHRYTIDGNENCIFHSLVFDPSVVGGSADSVFSRNYIFPLANAQRLPYVIFSPDTDWGTRCLQAIERAYLACEEEDDGYEFVIREEMSHVCGLVIRGHRDRIFTDKHPQSVDNARIRRLLDYIHAHYAEPIALDDLAAIVNLCPRECQRCFKKVLHISPTTYILQFRLQTAVGLLMDSRLSITEISGAVGFNSPSYFGKMFRKYFGMSPNEYRNRK